MKKTPKIVITLIVFASIVWCVESYASESTVQRAIVHLLTSNMPKFRIEPAPNHRLLKESHKHELVALSQAIYQAAHDHGIPPMLLVVMAYREGGFRHGSVGDIDERSMFQIVKKTARAVRIGRFPWTKYNDPGCDLRTVEGSSRCAAALLRIHKMKCGDLPGAVILYATGHTCRPYDVKLRWLQRDRINLQRELERLFESEDNKSNN